MGGILSILAGLAIAGLLRLINPGTSKTEPVPAENEKGGGGYILDWYGGPVQFEGDGVLKALFTAYRDLQRQHAAGFSSWISACIERAQRGYEIPPAVALLALERTRDELTGRRFNLEKLNEAIYSVELETGEGD